MIKLLFKWIDNARYMKVVCAWCGAHLSGDPNDPDISHGICDGCAAKWEK